MSLQGEAMRRAEDLASINDAAKSVLRLMFNHASSDEITAAGKETLDGLKKLQTMFESRLENAREQLRLEEAAR